jgi:hypothetical protein
LTIAVSANVLIYANDFESVPLSTKAISLYDTFPVISVSELHWFNADWDPT